MPSTTVSPSASRALTIHLAVSPIDSRGSKMPLASWPTGKKRIAVQPCAIRSLACSIISSPGGSDVVAKVGMRSRCLPPSRLVDRHAERLGLDVVERDVDGRERRLQHAAALEILAAIDLLPDRPDVEGVAADQELAEVLDGADHRLFAAR